ncbi:hypothetical protein IHE45_17G044100 [Dioscorea alata]|uniref:Uncharacterized protein n=1 Tax=Dioscorea alata TaxID=55571 RepID=A0ACB7UBW0_DIOAL|nr:hypothetical protein IHE45_17G044100 [Dioscorea alata]
MIPPEPANKKRGRKPMLRRKEAGEENVGFCNGRVSRKRPQKKCSVYGVQGHNKRYHGLQGNSRRETTQEAEQIVGEANVNDDDTNGPMEAIDPQVDLLSKNIGNEEPVAESNVSEPVSQMINISVQAFPGLAPEIQSQVKRPKLDTRGGKRDKLNDNRSKDRNMEEIGAKKKKVWVPPGCTAYGKKQ